MRREFTFSWHLDHMEDVDNAVVRGDFEFIMSEILRQRSAVLRQAEIIREYEAGQFKKKAFGWNQPQRWHGKALIGYMSWVDIPETPVEIAGSLDDADDWKEHDGLSVHYDFANSKIVDFGVAGHPEFNFSL